MRDPLADATAVESPAADPLAGAIRMGATMQATSDPLSAARQIPTVESETLQHGPISRILDILPQLAYDMTVGPLVSAGQVLREGRTPEQAQAWEQMTPEQRAVAKESGQGSASPFTLSPEMFGPQLGAIQNLAIMGALGEQGGIGAVPMGAGRGFLKPKTQPSPATTTVPSPTPILPPELQDVVNGDATAFLKPPVNEGTVPTVGEQVLQGMDLKKVAGQTGMGYFKGRDGTEVIFNPDLTKTSALKVLDKQGKLPEIVNGPGTAPKPSVPTDAVVVKSPDGTEIRTILTDTPEKTAAAVEAQPSTAQVEVKPAAEAVPQVIQDRMQQAIRTNVEDARTSIPIDTIRSQVAKGEYTLTRTEESGVTTDPNKPHGLYYSFDIPGLESPHSDLGGDTIRITLRPRNPLILPESTAINQFDAGVTALQSLIPPEQFEALRRLGGVDFSSMLSPTARGTVAGKKSLQLELSRLMPALDTSRYFDSYEMLGAYGSALAKKAGYDALVKIDPSMPEFSEVVSLTGKQAHTQPKPLQAQATSGSSKIIDHWRSEVEPALKEFFKAADTFGVARLEENNIKPTGMSLSDWLIKVAGQSATWDKGRKIGSTGIEMLSHKNLWPTTGPEGESLRRSMLSAVRNIRNAPGRSDAWIRAQESSTTQTTGTPTQPPLITTQATMPHEGLQAKTTQVEHGDLLEGFKPPEAKAPELPLQAKPTSEPPPSPVVDYGVIAKGIADSINQSFAPMQSAAGRISAIRNGFKTIFAANKTSEPAERFFAGWREMRGSAQLEVSRAEGAMQSAVDYFDKLPKQDQIAFGSRIARHEAQPNPEMRVLAENYRKLMDRGWSALNEVGEAPSYLEDYFGTMFKNPEAQVRQVYSQLPRRPLGGRAGFNYEKFYQDWQDAIDRGLEPVTYNPIKLGLLKYGEMINYAEAARLRNALIDEQVLTPVFEGEKAPYGYQVLKGRLWSFKGRSESPSLGEGGKIAQPGGRWAVPDDVARLVDYVQSSSLTQNAYTGQVFNWLRGVTNTSNIMKMGASGFHYFTTMKNEIGAEAAIAAVRAARGEFPRAIMSLAKSPVSPLTGFREGGQIAAEYVNPGSYPQHAQVVDWMRIANIKPKQWEAYTNQHLEQVKVAWKNGELATIAKQGLPAMVEYTSKFLMRRWIPQLSFSMFKDVATLELSKLPADADHFLVQKTLQKVADQVQNRMGQITQENLPWHQYTKDLSHAVMAFPLWNIGNVRSVAAGIADLAKIQRSVTAKGIDIPETVMFPAVLTTMVGLLGGLKHWNNTGQAPWEDYNGGGFWTNSFKPGDGSGGRLNQAWMFRDFLPPPRRLSNVLVMLRNKAIGPISAFGQFAMNDDFHGGLVYDPTSSPQQQILDITKNTARVLYEPISLSSAIRLLQQGQTPSQAAWKALTGENPVGRSGLTPTEEDALFQRRYRKQLYRLEQGRQIPSIGN